MQHCFVFSPKPLAISGVCNAPPAEHYSNLLKSLSLSLCLFFFGASFRPHIWQLRVFETSSWPYGTCCFMPTSSWNAPGSVDVYVWFIAWQVLRIVHAHASSAMLCLERGQEEGRLSNNCQRSGMVWTLGETDMWGLYAAHKKGDTSLFIAVVLTTKTTIMCKLSVPWLWNKNLPGHFSQTWANSSRFLSN